MATPRRQYRKSTKAAPREAVVEAKAVKQMREAGALVCKLSMMYQRAWPDRLIIPPGVEFEVHVCRTVKEAMDVYEDALLSRAPCMIEFKRMGAVLTQLQEQMAYELMTGKRRK